MAQLLGLSDQYDVLFLHGGARLQFSMIPINFLRGAGKPADFIVTGHWGADALKESQREGVVHLAWDGKPTKYTRTPKDEELKLDADAAYVHYTSNETIEGVQFPAEPNVGAVPAICDMSSDFLSRPIAVGKYAMIYAGAQKNAGPAGLAVVIIRKDMLDRIPDGLHSMLDYRVHSQNDSTFNTPPCFPIYMVMLTTQWLLRTIGGLAKMDAINRRKAKMLYDIIDQSDGFFKGHAAPESRSAMNVTFRLPSEDAEKAFVKEATEAGLHELKGHRSVGGMRASIYNAMPVEGVEKLAEFMQAFRKKSGK
ncbi:MAG: 3-phosphoserine/phosphohydroxythreonine transaminase [Candidatus Sumerlaeota bacterium]|nr:3-phosphoserine/phosphohydroxythreonine transaminase [Candidatus Sumerlaeota bacterium]